ncbi:MAG TPA: glycosyltransferase family A protein [Bacteroidales bacterium]|nr:glycosyltransferase family A protein [Bacteroidales bacterium]HPS50616.1 glycosyltransferase family A protein [Bacteroidales bacterium]
MPDAPPPVSIIIPAYNAGKFIAETLDSVVRQTYPSWEAFVVDDGSRDQTIAIAKSFEKYGSIRVLEQKNSGACVARNLGMSLSRGKYIQYLDADDVLSPDKLEKQVEVLEQNPGYLAICPTVHFMNSEDYLTMSPREESFWIHDTNDPVDFLVRLYGGDGERWMVQTSAWLTPRSVTDQIGPWDERLLLDQDGEYFARAVLASKGIRTTGGMNYYRRFSYGSNISAKANKIENLQSALLALDLKAGYLEQHTRSDRFQRAMSTLYMEIAINAYPMFPELVAICEERVRKTGKKPEIPVLGGKLIEATKYLFGWKAAKLLRKNIHAILKRGRVS